MSRLRAAVSKVSGAGIHGLALDSLGSFSDSDNCPKGPDKSMSTPLSCLKYDRGFTNFCEESNCTECCFISLELKYDEMLGSDKNPESNVSKVPDIDLFVLSLRALGDDGTIDDLAADVDAHPSA